MKKNNYKLVNLTSVVQWHTFSFITSSLYLSVIYFKKPAAHDDSVESMKCSHHFSPCKSHLHIKISDEACYL
ncbi:hypothetical protein HanRHA438_Chr17g0797721 [Helianthus annuus]|nr:hypothetical protein HanRHA438_Chr17g0797721 [Helianthus annuus]